MKFKTSAPHFCGYFVFIIFLGAAFCLLTASPLTAAAPSKQGGDFLTPSSFSDISERVSPAVVNIRTVKTVKGGGRVFRHFMPGPFEKEDPFQDFFNKFFGDEQQRDFKQRSLGSGFIIDKEGFIVTNNHVVENADKIKVKLKNGDEFDAEIVGRDANTDLSLIKIKSKNNLPVVKIGDSDAIKVGQWVVAIGSPFGFEQTLTAGIVSAKGRVIGSGPYDDFIQTDASINPGNSGGPLINMAGEVVGINTAIIASGQGIGFAIPINMAKGIIDQLKTSGEVTRGWLGVAIQPLSQELADYYGIKDGKGVLVTEVFSGDPAEKAGVKPRDIILEVNNKRVEESRDLTRMIANTAVGETVTLKVLRDGQEKIFRVEIAKRDEVKLSSRQPERKDEDTMGIRVTDLTAEVARRFNLKDPEGVIVVGVEAESKGGEAGMQVGDIIKEVNHQAVQTVADYTREIAAVQPGESIQLFIRRMNAGFVVIKLVK
ncbi:MAG: DegQ family serine endoprotease [Desulfobacterales bacterium]|nr:DegQ family serine endoprotease [Desulfobacterales bacterium]